MVWVELALTFVRQCLVDNIAQTYEFANILETVMIPCHTLSIELPSLTHHVNIPSYHTLSTYPSTPYQHTLSTYPNTPYQHTLSAHPNIP